ncbi:hypothetical protein TNCV_5128731 [Trichonephila clavipes]|nr:hypothetical protein TNCV_5128731 [Trichonephila clavipes]
MAPESPAISGSTCGRRISWIYRWAVIVPWINIRGDHVFSRLPGSIPLQSNNIVSTPLQMEVSVCVSLAAHVMGAAISDVLHPGSLRWFRKTEGLVVKVLHVPGQRLMRQLALRMRVV